MDKLSDFDLLMILNCLDLNSRGRCACVSRRWRKLLLCRSSTRIDVLNMFDLNVWHQLSGNLKSRLGPQVLVQTKEELEGLLKLVRDVDVFKIWFDHEDFAESILTTAERLRQDIHSRNEKSESELLQFRVSGLDLYPYCDFVSLIPIKNVSSLQNTTRLTLRPHGKDKFWQGVTVAQLPGLPQLRTLRLESVFLLPTVCLPANITELEWKAPRGDNDELSKLLSKLVDDCVGLKYILLSHVDFKVF